MASHLHQVGLDITPAVGAAAATEFRAYTALYHSIPDLAQILRGKGDGIAFPAEPSMRYATVVGLLTRAEDPPTGYHAFRWMTQTAPIEWVQLCATDLFRLMRARQKIRPLFALINQDAALQKWMEEYRQLMRESSGEA